MTVLAWGLLLGGIVSEVAGTLSLRIAIDRGARWYAVVACGYVAAFAFLDLALAQGMPLGVAYGIWTAIGVVLTALFAKVLFEEPVTWVMSLGIVLVGSGVLLIELGAAS